MKKMQLKNAVNVLIVTLESFRFPVILLFSFKEKQPAASYMCLNYISGQCFMWLYMCSKVSYKIFYKEGDHQVVSIQTPNYFLAEDYIAIVQLESGIFVKL